MKNKNKALLLSLCAALLVVATVLTTIAWLTSTTGPVTNTFTVGNVKIELWEAETDALGEKFYVVSGGTSSEVDNYVSATPVKENEYTLRPGHEYKKEVYIEILPGSEPCYLFVKVENGLEGNETDAVGGTIEEQMYQNGWVPVVDHPNVWALHVKQGGANFATTKEEFIAFYNAEGNVRRIVEYDADTFNHYHVFSRFTLGGGADADALKDENITITAYAVQADGFDATHEVSYGASTVPMNSISDKEVWEAAFPQEPEETTTPEPTT